MTAQMIVLPANCGLEKKVKKRTLILHVGKIEDAVSAYATWSRENKVFCIVVHLEKPLQEIKLDESVQHIPLALYAHEEGDPRTLIASAEQYRNNNISLFFPAHEKKNFTCLRILSSLGVPSGVYIADMMRPVDWDLMNDLMYYSVYTRTNHAPIEPFAYVTSHYDPQEAVCFTAPWFEDPKQFLYMDRDENIACSRSDLEGGDFIATGIEALDSLAENETYNEKLTAWMNQFIDNRRCAACPAWRVCGGSFLSICENDPNYFQFFNDLMEAAEHTAGTQKRTSAWRL